MTRTPQKRPTTAAAWLKRNDAGPHLVTLPSGAAVRIRIPDTSALLKSGRLPEGLREAAVIFTSHPDGTDELMRELVLQAAFRGPGQETLSAVIKAGRDLTPYLLSEMLVEPQLTPEEVEALPELDRWMLLEFADRRRNVDAAGNEVPIVTLDEWATFRRQPGRPRGSGNGGADEHEPDGALPAPDAEEV